MGCPCENIASPIKNLSEVCIGNLWLFNNITSDEMGVLAGNAKRRQLKKGQFIFHQDDTSIEMFLLKSGRVKLTKILENGNEITLDIRKAGDFIGENIFSEESAYPVNAVCMDNTLTCGFTGEQLNQIILQHPNIGLQIIKNMSERISQLTSKVGSMAEASIEDRLYSVLKHVANEHGIPCSKGLKIQFPLTHEELSFLIGAHRVSVTRAMKYLKETGKIETEHRSLIITPI
jgi:CRP/FNR family transcriptional regulator